MSYIRVSYLLTYRIFRGLISSSFFHISSEHKDIILIILNVTLKIILDGITMKQVTKKKQDVLIFDILFVVSRLK